MSGILKGKEMVLGTALWGWGVDRAMAAQLLESFVLSGGTVVDTATNYPINKSPIDHGKAIHWLSDFLHTTSGDNVSLLIKIGSADNSGSDKVELQPDSIWRTAENLRQQFGSKLGCISVHWDNRGEEPEDRLRIAETVSVLSDLRADGIEVGLSGIRHPALYFDANPELAEHWIIQVKENLSTCAARVAYQRVFPNARYLAYGINMGGIKLSQPKQDSSVALRNIEPAKKLLESLSNILAASDEFQPRPATTNDLALLSVYGNEHLDGLIIGPRDVAQLRHTLNYWHLLQSKATAAQASEFLTEMLKRHPLQ